MKNLWQVLRGILIALVSVGLLFGGLSLSMAEGNLRAPDTKTPEPPTATRTIIPASATPTLKIIVTNTATKVTSTPTPTLTLTLPPTPTNCPPPVGWVPIQVRLGDTLVTLATRYHTSAASLQSGNCLKNTELVVGSILYVPPPATQTHVPCGHPAGWVLTFVQPGDTLYRLSQAYGITVSQLQNANCMGNSTLLRVGSQIYVPPWATRTPLFPFPPGETPTYVPTDTVIEITPTETNPPVFFWTETPTEMPTP